jgi:hypothetical protein
VYVKDRMVGSTTMTDGRVRWWRFAIATLAVAAGWWGCTSAAPEPPHGDPTGLRAQNLPGEGGVVITGACEAGLPADILDGGTTDVEGGVAVREGGAGDAGNCKVSFSQHLYPRILIDGGWKCASSACHGSTQTPLFDASTPESLLSDLRGYSAQGHPYVAPATGPGADPTKSEMYCNLSRTCLTAMPPSPALAPQEVCALETWLRCGAPDN